MTRHELEQLHGELNIEFAQLQRLSDFSAEAPHIRQLARAAMILSRHLIEVDKEIAKLKRGVSHVRPKKK